MSEIAAPRFLCYETMLGVRFTGNQYRAVVCGRNVLVGLLGPRQRPVF